jgi:aminoglycoside 3-N-acetyltransferase
VNLDILQETLKNASPRSVRWAARALLKGSRKVRNRAQRLRGSAVDQAAIVAAMRRLGIRSGDILIVHSSLSRLGFVVGGVDAVVMALKEAVGVNGTLGAPTFWTADPNAVEEGTLFDAIRGKSQMGSISERIRQLPGAVRSLHPTHSATFVGPFARELTAEHHNDDTPVGPHSPYRKLAAMNGKILLLGVTLEYLTSFHTIEDETAHFTYQIYNRERKRFRVLSPEGEELTLHARTHSAETARLRQCTMMEPHLVAAGVMVKGPVGNGDAILLDAKGLHETLHRLCERGITIYAPEGYAVKGNLPQENSSDLGDN